MSALPKQLLTPEEYLAKERRAEFRSEYYRGEMFAMAGASYKHTRVKDNLARHVGNQLEGGPCFTMTSDQRVKVSPTGLYTYPDVIVVCDEPQFEDDQFDTLLNPRVVFEVLSDSTEKYDRGDKFDHYRQVPSLQEYILVSQKRPYVERRVRQADGAWTLTVFNDLSQALELASVPVRVPLTEIYRGVTFPATPESDSRPGFFQNP